MNQSDLKLSFAQKTKKLSENEHDNILASINIETIYFKDYSNQISEQLKKAKLLSITQAQLYVLDENNSVLKQFILNHQLKFQVLKDAQQGQKNLLEQNSKQNLKGLRFVFNGTLQHLKEIQIHIKPQNAIFLSKFCRILQYANVIQLDFHSNFKLHRLIAKGGFSNVLQVWRLRDSKLKAIKAVSKKCRNWDRQDVLHEGNVLKTLNYRGIVRYEGLYESQGSFYLVFENLRRSLNFHELNSSLAYLKFVFQRLLKTLEYLKSKNIIHRDIKLDNIMLRQSKSSQFAQPVVLDFGFAINANQTNIKYKTPGTYGYYAPQIFASQKQGESKQNSKFTFASDIFQLGVVFFELLTTKPLIYAQNKQLKQLMQKNRNFKASPKIFQGFTVNQEAKDLIMKMLHESPDKRITVEEALAHKLFQIEQNQTMPIIQNNQSTIERVIPQNTFQ